MSVGALIGGVGSRRPDSQTDSSLAGENRSTDELLASHPYFVPAFNSLKMHIGRGGVAADLGCGHEMIDLRILGSYGFSLPVGIDIISRPAALDKDERLSYVRGDVDESKLPLAGGSCDVVILNNILEHLHNPMNALTEATRILRKGGLLVIITPNQADLKNRLFLLTGRSIHFPLRRWLLEGSDRISRGSRSVFIGHVREYTARELVDMVALTGCDLIETRYIATARSRLRGERADCADMMGHVETLTRNSRFLFAVYSVLEIIVPSFRAQISVVARKT